MMSEEEQVQTEVVTQTEPTPIESEARTQGWVPKEEFRGNESDWIEAEVFVQRGKEINPILRKNNERIQKELDATRRQMEDLKKATDEFKVFQKEAYTKKLADYELEISDLKDLKRKAVSEGDGDLVVELDDKIEEIRTKKISEVPPKDSPKTTVEPKVTGEIVEWVESNKWYKEDPKMANAANRIAEQIRLEFPYAVGKDFLDKLDKELETMFLPEKLGRKSRPRSPVEGSKVSHTEGRTGKKSYDNLPSDAKAACDKFVKQKLMSRDEYVTMYSWE